MSIADIRFRDLCRDILEFGESSEGTQVRPKWSDGTPAHTVSVFSHVTHYNLRQEFPAITLRPTMIKKAFDEILWIWQKKSNRLADLDSHIWDQWGDADGTIGKAYGYQLAQKYDFGNGRVMDQVDNILWQLKNTPSSRRMMTSLYNFSDLSEMGLEPCAWSTTWGVKEGKLHMILNQRSQDVLVANNWNVCQYALLQMIFAHVSGLEPGCLTHVIADAHIYDRHVPIVRELIEREMFVAPRVTINTEKTNFYDFTVDDVTIENYKTGEQIKDIPVAE